MRAEADVKPPGEGDRFALVAGSIVCLAAVGYAIDLFGRTPRPAGQLLTAGALLLLGLSMVAQGRGHRSHWPLRWAALAVWTARMVWFPW